MVAGPQSDVNCVVAFLSAVATSLVMYNDLLCCSYKVNIKMFVLLCYVKTGQYPLGIKLEVNSDEDDIFNGFFFSNFIIRI